MVIISDARFRNGRLRINRFAYGFVILLPNMQYE